MTLSDSVKEALLGKLSGLEITSAEFLADLLIAISLIIIGIFIGKIIKFILRKGLEKIKIEKIIKHSFINLFLVVIKWSIYILFLNLALIQLNIPTVTSWLITILGMIPALTGALVIISAGFTIATYLKRIVSESKVEGWPILSQIFFLFVIYIFMVFAFRTALISLNDKFIINILLVVFTILGGIAILIYYFKNKR